jgi:DNA invertase Pin-like site-specific DNA recombinase
MISAGTKAALAAAKRRGVVCVKASIKVRRGNAEKRASDLLPEIEAIRTEGATTLREIAAALNEKGITAPRGGEWSAVQVHRVLVVASAV